MHLRNFDTEKFLREYWQKKPLLIRSPWTSWSNPVDPDELAGLACDPHVESRLITQSSTDWELENGPLAEDRFERQGKDPWTLLVQAVDHHVPSAASLLDSFRFVPNWRVDDVMVSYAVDGGGVGAHFDHYDVFLVQGLGRRCWELGGLCDEYSKLLPHSNLLLLADFQPTDEWVLEEGDILYVPPRFAHRGTAVGDDCMTYSIGFRAPSRAELIENWADDLADSLPDQDRYTDPGLAQQANPGEIGVEAIAQLHSMITDTILERNNFAQWFGRYNSSPKNPDIDWRPETPVDVDDIRQNLAEGAALMRNPASRFSFIRETPSSILLFVDGQCFSCNGEEAVFAERICAEVRLSVDSDGSLPLLEMIRDLFNQGSIAFEL
ncbi:cupin domain-containing protein [Erythrobacter crassostreae]|uniref:Cupin domain-containing protein n=1 Tax=Erythrobacter crassostreae TaxID=2828328 RepID=A0A9X1F193_9SPHN|nr:cupin domain-containing protein [Erythrobacter crassostrea]MBV7258466.1 cupin domain-containing protein [Erythrobacter crassostrea]